MKKTETTSKTKLGMDKKHLNESIHIYSNPEIVCLHEVELEKIEKYEGAIISNKDAEILRIIKKQKMSLQEKIEYMNFKFKNDIKQKRTYIKKNTENSNNPRYFPLNSKYELQLIATVIKKDRKYLEWWLENSFDKTEQRNMYIAGLLKGDIMMDDYTNN